MLKELCKLNGIGITIGTGLIWSVFPEIRVPFDKYTLTLALKRRIVLTENVSENYVLFSDNISSYCSGFTIEGIPYSIEDFVRQAMAELWESEYFAIPR